MLKIVLYAYHEGVYSSRDIEKACNRDINFMYLLEGMPAPDHTTISRFISLHFSECAEILMAFSHINSTPRECLNGKTPYEIFEFFYGKEILDKFNIRKIALDEVTLMPYLIDLK